MNEKSGGGPAVLGAEMLGTAVFDTAVFDAAATGAGGPGGSSADAALERTINAKNASAMAKAQVLLLRESCGFVATSITGEESRKNVLG
jgi:hypothetical protein